MRTILFNPTMLIGACVLMVGCAYPHPGPQYQGEDNALLTSSGTAAVAPAPATKQKPASKTPEPSKPVTSNPPTPSSSAPSTSTASVPSSSSRPKSKVSAPASVPVAATSEPLPVAPPKKAKTLPAPAPEATSEPPSAPPSAPLPQQRLLFPPDPGTPSTPSDTTSNTPDASSGFDNIEIVDNDLNGKLTVLRVGSEPTPNNLLSVFTGLKNKTAQPLRLEVQTLYKDKDGKALNTGSWVSMTLKSHEETEYRSASLSEDATDFVVRIRRAPKPAAGADGSP